jgi:hypothetical protein
MFQGHISSFVSGDPEHKNVAVYSSHGSSQLKAFMLICWDVVFTRASRRGHARVACVSSKIGNTSVHDVLKHPVALILFVLYKCISISNTTFILVSFI